MIQLIKEDGTVYGPGSIQIIDKYGKPKIPVIPPSATVWGTITGTVIAQTDLTGYISSNYYPLVTNPSGFITSAALTPYLTSATAASTYYPLTNPSNYISGITSGMVTTALGYTAANQDGTILYHSIKWFTPSDTVSSSGTTVTSIGTQFLSTMVGSKLTISGESRIITVYTSTTQVTVNSAYSINYSGIAPASWGVYSKGLELGAANGLVTAYSGFQNGGAPAGSVIFTYSAGYITNDFGYKLNNNRCAFIYNTEGSNSWSINWSSTTNYGNTKDIGIKRNAAGVLEINNGIGTTGLLADRRDLLVRNVKASSLTLDLAPFTITGSNNTLQTASTAVVGINYLGGSTQWATGAITTQSENVWGATTYSFVGASTIDTAYGNVFNAATAGTNATITNNYAAHFTGNIFLSGGNRTIKCSNGLILEAASGSPLSLRAGSAGSINIGMLGETPGLVYRGYSTSGAITNFFLNKENAIGQTASTSISGWNYVGNSRTWLTGNITTQNENVWGAVTYNFGGASIITNAYGNVFNAPIAGTNCTITSNWAAQFNGNVVIGSTGQLIEIKQTATAPTFSMVGSASSIFTIGGGIKTMTFESYSGDANYFSSTGATFRIRTTDAQNIQFYTNGTQRFTIGSDGNFYIPEAGNFIFGVTTGTKFGQSATQKIGFWNATPIVRPATGGGASTFVSNTSLIANDTATFDGYTIGQIVKALRNMGLLA